MAVRGYKFSPPTNPILQVVYFVVGGIVLIGAVLMASFVLAIALGVALVLGVIIYIRMWWLGRKLARTGARAGDDDDALEVEYSIVDERDERNERRSED